MTEEPVRFANNREKFERSAREWAKGLMILSRLPFLSPGLASLVTGMAIAVLSGYEADPGLVGMSVGGLCLIMLATYYFNEYYDYEGDVINRTFIVFSGGSRALPENMVPRKVARLAGLASVAFLVSIAVAYLVWYFAEYPLLLPLALYGAFCGVFYSHPPFKWAYQGIGEVIIGGCYGLLALVSGYYVASSVLAPEMLAVALPASISIFCVIVANEFPDIEADRAVGKRNLVVRLGLSRAAKMYAAAMASVYPAMLLTILVGVSPWIALFGLPVALLCALAIRETLKGGYADPESQTVISGITLLANLLSSLLFIPVFAIW